MKSTPFLSWLRLGAFGLLLTLGNAACTTDSPGSASAGPGVELPAAASRDSIPPAIGPAGNGGGVSGGGAGAGTGGGSR